MKKIYLLILLTALFVVSGCEQQESRNSLLGYEDIGIVLEGTLIQDKDNFYLIEEQTKEKILIQTCEGELWSKDNVDCKMPKSFTLDDFNINSRRLKKCTYCKKEVLTNFPIHALVTGILTTNKNQKVIFIGRSHQWAYSFIAESEDVFNPLLAIKIAENAIKERIIDQSKDRTEEINLILERVVIDDSNLRISFRSESWHKSALVSLEDGSVESVKDIYSFLE